MSYVDCRHILRPCRGEVCADRLYVPACRGNERKRNIRHQEGNARRDDNRHHNRRGRQAHFHRRKQRFCFWMGNAERAGGRLQHRNRHWQRRVRKAFRRCCGCMMSERPRSVLSTGFVAERGRLPTADQPPQIAEVDGG